MKDMDSDKSIELISKENDKQSEKDNIIDINTNKANKNDTTVLTNYQSTNILSQLFMTWASSILHYPKKDKLTFEHLPPLSKANDSSSLSSFLDNIWTTEGYSKHKTNALFKALIRANIWRFCLMFIMNIISSLTEYLMIILLKLKRNIDPFGSSSDSEIFDILKNLCYDIKDKSELTKTIMQNGSISQLGKDS